MLAASNMQSCESLSADLTVRNDRHSQYDLCQHTLLMQAPDCGASLLQLHPSVEDVIERNGAAAWSNADTEIIMTFNASSDSQGDSYSSPKATDTLGMSLSQQVHRIDPVEFLNAIQNMTNNSGSSDLVQPMTIFGATDGSGSAAQAGSPASNQFWFSPESSNSASATAGKDAVSAVVPAGQTDGSSIVTGGPNDVSSIVTGGPNDVSSVVPGGQSDVSSVVPSTQGDVSSTASAGQNDASTAVAGSNATTDSTSAAQSANGGDSLKQIESQIINEFEQLFQLLEKQFNPQPPTEQLQGDVKGITQPGANDKTLQVSTTNGQSESVPMPSDYNGTGTFSLHSDGVLAYSGPSGSSGGECYLNDSQNPPQWVNYDGPNSQRPSGEVVQSWTPTQQATDPTKESDVSSITPPAQNATTMEISTTEGDAKTVPVPPAYAGVGEFALSSTGVLSFGDNKGNLSYLNDSQNPPQWVSADTPDSTFRYGTIVRSWGVGENVQNPLTSDVSNITLPGANDKTMQIQTTDGQTQSVPVPFDFNNTGSFSLDSNGVLCYAPSTGVGGQCYLDNSTNPPGWVDYDGNGPNMKYPSGDLMQLWQLPNSQNSTS